MFSNEIPRHCPQTSFISIHFQPQTTVQTPSFVENSASTNSKPSPTTHVLVEISTTKIINCAYCNKFLFVAKSKLISDRKAATRKSILAYERAIYKLIYRRKSREVKFKKEKKKMSKGPLQHSINFFFLDIFGMCKKYSPKFVHFLFSSFFFFLTSKLMQRDFTGCARVVTIIIIIIISLIKIKHTHKKNKQNTN